MMYTHELLGSLEAFEADIWITRAGSSYTMTMNGKAGKVSQSRQPCSLARDGKEMLSLLVAAYERKLLAEKP